MESVFGIVFPIFGIILVGYAVGRVGLLGPPLTVLRGPPGLVLPHRDP